VWHVSSENAVPIEVEITKVGRKWVYIPARWGNLAAFSRETLKANISSGNSYGRLFVAFEDIAVYRAAEEEKRAAETAWREFRRHLPHWCPEHMTAADIARIRAKIEGRAEP